MPIVSTACPQRRSHERLLLFHLAILQAGAMTEYVDVLIVEWRIGMHTASGGKRKKPFARFRHLCSGIYPGLRDAPTGHRRRCHGRCSRGHAECRLEYAGYRLPARGRCQAERRVAWKLQLMSPEHFAAMRGLADCPSDMRSDLPVKEAFGGACVLIRVSKQ